MTNTHFIFLMIFVTGLLSGFIVGMFTGRRMFRIAAERYAAPLGAFYDSGPMPGMKSGPIDLPPMPPGIMSRAEADARGIPFEPKGVTLPKGVKVMEIV